MKYSTKTPKPDEVHYSAKKQSSVTITEAYLYWLVEANKAMLYQLAEEIEAGEYEVGSEWWNAQVHKRALELIQTDETMLPAVKTRILATIENEALYAYAGFESAEEWFACQSSLGRGGQATDYKWIASTLIPWCKAEQIFDSPASADHWFFTPTNGDGSSRYGALRDAITDLRDIIERDVYPDLAPQEKKTIVTNILGNVADTTKTRSEKRVLLNEVRGAKMVIQIHKNGDGLWHLTGNLTDHQKERLLKDLKYSAIIEFLSLDSETES